MSEERNQPFVTSPRVVLLKHAFFSTDFLKSEANRRSWVELADGL